MNRRPKRTFTKEFKLQVVNLYNSGKSAGEIIKEYDLNASSFYKWVNQFSNSGSFKEIDNLSDEQKLIRQQEKELKQLRMENDILKQAALIMGQKSKL
ncbi:transposase [Bacilli bacterium PM5-3]|nr:transposase [Bacilli bacterium PM5-3]MDH6604365.1 transposase [Bacilli bacterium PM5-9]